MRVLSELPYVSTYDEGSVHGDGDRQSASAPNRLAPRSELTAVSDPMTGSLEEHPSVTSKPLHRHVPTACRLHEPRHICGGARHESIGGGHDLLHDTRRAERPTPRMPPSGPDHAGNADTPVQGASAPRTLGAHPGPTIGRSHYGPPSRRRGAAAIECLYEEFCVGNRVELRGFEPLTSCMPWGLDEVSPCPARSPNVPAVHDTDGPQTVQPQTPVANQELSRECRPQT